MQPRTDDPAPVCAFCEQPFRDGDPVLCTFTWLDGALKPTPVHYACSIEFEATRVSQKVLEALANLQTSDSAELGDALAGIFRGIVDRYL